MTLLELIKSVREEKLSKEQLEDYNTQLSNLFAQMMLEIADLEKSEAIFMQFNADRSVAQRKIEWKATEKGQRLITLKRYVLATKELISSTKNRIYKLIY